MGALINIDTDGLAKFGETICYGFGLTAFGRKKMANAESYAAIKKAETDTQIELLRLKGEEEVANYVLAKESRKMNNVLSVAEIAQSHLIEGESVSNEPVNVDWINRFFSIVEDVSDRTLHEMWGRILAGEVKRPKSYSLRTLELLKNITKDEAELFLKACHCYVAKNYICTEKFALSLHEVLLLGETGLLNNEELTKEWKVEPKNKLEIMIDSDNFLILHNDKEKQINCYTSVKRLSTAGCEILSLTEQSSRGEFYDNLARFFKSKGVDRVFKHNIVEIGGNILYKKIGEELAVS